MASPAHAALARGLLRLLAADGGTLTESRLLAACGSSAPKGKLRRILGDLVESGHLSRVTRGRGARLTIPGGQEAALLDFVRRHLSPRSRVPGGDVRHLLEMLGERAHPHPPAPPEEAVLPAPELDPHDVFLAIEQLARESALGGMVKIPDLARRLGLNGSGELERPLRLLARDRRVQLDPLSDPRVVPAAERGLGIRDPYRGMLFYVSLPRGA